MTKPPFELLRKWMIVIFQHGWELQAKGLAEFDRMRSSIEKTGKTSLENKENKQIYSKFQKELDEILVQYF